VARGLAKPTDDLPAGADLVAGGYAPETLKMAKLGGTLHGLPLTSSTPVTFFNAALVTQAGGDPANLPKDRDATIAVAGNIDKLGPDIIGMDLETGTGDWMTQNLLRSYRVSMMSKDGATPRFDSPQAVAAIDLFRRFHTEGGHKGFVAEMMVSGGQNGPLLIPIGVKVQNPCLFNAACKAKLVVLKILDPQMREGKVFRRHIRLRRRKDDPADPGKPDR